MEIIKVDAIDSTNVFLRDLNRKRNLNSTVCVVAHKQTQGKGQMGTTWQSNPGENLTCSVYQPIKCLELMDQFYISMATALAIHELLEGLMIPKVTIKWPNDILSDKRKTCGILIENVVKNGRLTGAILGIGLNVNQSEFVDLPQATSLKQMAGKVFDLDEVLHQLLYKIEQKFLVLNQQNYERIKSEYESLLFRRNKPSTFMDAKGDSFVGIIKTITNEGKLQLLLEDEVTQDYDLKEIKLLY